MSAIVFVGPTLGAASVASILAAELRPPAGQGDVYKAARSRPRAIGIIDGYFDGVPAVCHKEILWAIEQGIAVFGSASMGALRAAELADFGMTGVGRIFEDYRGGRLGDDDEVAVLHGPAELGFRPLSEPMVSIRATLERAVAEGALDAEAARVLAATAKALHYRDRTWKAVLGRVASDRRLAGFADWLATGRVDAKADDARRMLERMAAFLAAGEAPPAPAARMERTLAWRDLVQRAEAEAETAGAGTPVSCVLDELRLDPSRYHAFRTRAALRLLALAEARRRGLEAPGEALRARMARHRAAAGLARRQDLMRWLARNDLDEGTYEAFLRDGQLAEAALPAQEDRLEPHILAELRWDDAYEDLRNRAAEKAALASADDDIPAAERLRLLLWYFETRLGRPAPDDPDAYARSIGLAGREELCRMIRREFLYAGRTAMRVSDP